MNKPKIGEQITVRLKSGQTMCGTYDVHSLAGECIRNQHGFPIQFDKIISDSSTRQAAGALLHRKYPDGLPEE